MLEVMEQGKRTGDCVTREIWERRALILQANIEVPANVSEGWGA